MQHLLRQSKGSGFNLDEPQGQTAIDSSSLSVRVRLSTDRDQVASRLVRMLGDTAGIDILSCAEAERAAPGPRTGQPPAVLLLDCAAFAPQERLRLQRTARSHYPAPVLWYLDATPSSDYAVQLVLNAVKAGWCHGYVAGDCAFDTLVRAITAVARNDIWLPRAMLVRALSESRSLRAAFGPRVAAVQEGGRARTLLTMRERQIMQLVRCGLTNKEMGRQLGIVEDTVKKHLRNLYAKLGVHRRAQMLLKSAGEAPAPG
jgi:LuxR family maltose regulon positive regulatory protein